MHHRAVPHDLHVDLGALRSARVSARALLDALRPGGLDPADDARIGQGAEHVVDGLVGDGRRFRADRCQDTGGVGVRVTAHGAQHGQSRSGDPQVSPAEQVLEVSLGGVVVHRSPPCPPFLNESSFLGRPARAI